MKGSLHIIIPQRVCSLAHRHTTFLSDRINVHVHGCIDLASGLYRKAKIWKDMTGRRRAHAGFDKGDLIVAVGVILFGFASRVVDMSVTHGLLACI
jgi:hypothetical protein